MTLGPDDKVKQRQHINKGHRVLYIQLFFGADSLVKKKTLVNYDLHPTTDKTNLGMIFRQVHRMSSKSH